MASEANPNAGTTVIGPTGYQQLGAELNANYMDVPQKTWEQLSPEQQDAVNQDFAYRVAQRGDVVTLSGELSC